MTAIWAFAPRGASAQGGPYGTVTVTQSYGYDANLLSAPSSTTLLSDEFARTAPTVEAGYAASLVRLSGRYSFDAERYRQHEQLNRMFAREDASFRLRMVPSERVRFSVDGAYLKTTTPSDLNLESLLAVGRTPTRRLTGETAFTYRATAVTDVTVGYEFDKDTLLGGVSGVAGVGNEGHTIRGGFEHRTATRDSVGVNYELRRIQFRDPFNFRTDELFHVVTARWRHEITPWTELDVEAGPHIGTDRIRPELSAFVRRQFGRGELSFGYSRSQVTTIGVPGTIDVHRLSGGGTFQPTRRITVTAQPAYAYTAQNTAGIPEGIPVYTLDADAIIQASERVAIAFTSRLGRQEGAIGGSRDTTPHQRFAVELVVTLLRTARADGEWPAVIGEEGR